MSTEEDGEKARRDKFIEELWREVEGLGIICLSDIIDAEITDTETGERMLVLDFDDGSSDGIVLKGAPRHDGHPDDTYGVDDEGDA